VDLYVRSELGQEKCLRQALEFLGTHTGQVIPGHTSMVAQLGPCVLRSRHLVEGDAALSLMARGSRGQCTYVAAHLCAPCTIPTGVCHSRWAVWLSWATDRTQVRTRLER